MLASKFKAERKRLSEEVDDLRNHAKDLARLISYIDELEKKYRVLEGRFKNACDDNQRVRQDLKKAHDENERLRDRMDSISDIVCPECGSPDPAEVHTGGCSYGGPSNG